YRAQEEGGLHDEGLRVLADEQIAYEADAILLVEREGDERTITPIIKPPRPAHLKLNKRYTATLATIYPDQVPDTDAKARRTTKQGAPAAAPAGRERRGAQDQPVVAGAPAEAYSAETNGRGAAPPRDPAEAEQRFFARYGEIVGGENWAAVQR